MPFGYIAILIASVVAAAGLTLGLLVWAGGMAWLPGLSLAAVLAAWAVHRRVR